MSHLIYLPTLFIKGKPLFKSTGVSYARGHALPHFDVFLKSSNSTAHHVSGRTKETRPFHLAIPLQPAS